MIMRMMLMMMMMMLMMVLMMVMVMVMLVVVVTMMLMMMMLVVVVMMMMVVVVDQCINHRPKENLPRTAQLQMWPQDPNWTNLRASANYGCTKRRSPGPQIRWSSLRWFHKCLSGGKSLTRELSWASAPKDTFCSCSQLDAPPLAVLNSKLETLKTMGDSKNDKTNVVWGSPIWRKPMDSAWWVEVQSVANFERSESLDAKSLHV